MSLINNIKLCVETPLSYGVNETDYYYLISQYAVGFKALRIILIVLGAFYIFLFISAIDVTKKIYPVPFTAFIFYSLW